MTKTWHTEREEELSPVAKDLIASMRGGEVTLLRGELGVGKTAFVRALAKSLGSTTPVRSPTFTLVHVYKTTHPIIRYLVHADFYRLSSAEGAWKHLGLDEWAERKDAIIVVEWPDEETKNRHDAGWDILFQFGATETARTIDVTPLCGGDAR
ncbi:tRNA (adenosine(37)-N6)-threonylcarbamoyltransferase complex ATPase subunit type 1 TsaE [Candidatus Uhrbacteria bacterium]|nr:tRNA (adenosine(37)-N6)-threonylcarbamoyltransferase complex ATPase subunit type 1 TsaE [Candidatus Uhrbacteria bacterium]